MSPSVKDGGLPPESSVQPEDDILTDSERLLGAHHDPAPHALIQIALAPCSPFAVTRSLVAASADLACKYGALLHRPS